MSFLYPLVLIAGLGLAIPIIIHLYNLKKFKKIYFSDISLIEQIVVKSKKHATIEKRLLLLSRLLIMASIILAFAQPFIKSSNHQSQVQPLVIVLDNSISMAYASGQTSRLEQAKISLQEFIKSQPNDLKYYLLTNNSSDLNNEYTQEEALDFLQQINYTSNELNLSSILEQLQLGFQEYPFQSVLLVSDWNQIAPLENNSQYDFDIQALKITDSNEPNIAIDTAYFSNPYLLANQENEFIVRLKKYHTNESKPANISIFNGDQLLTSGTVNFDLNDTVSATFSFNLPAAQWYNIKATIEPDGLPADDTFYIAGQTSPQRNVLLIGNKINPYLQSAFNAIPDFKYSTYTPNTDWKDYSLIIVQEAEQINNTLIEQLKFALQQGKNVWIIPTKNNIIGYKEAFQSLANIQLLTWDTAQNVVNHIQTNHPLFKKVFANIDEQTTYPKVTGSYTKSNTSHLNELPIISFRNGQPLLAQYTDNNYLGNLYILFSTLALQHNTLLSANYFAPMIMRMSEANAQQNIFTHTLGDPTPLKIINENKNDVWHIKSNHFDIIPQQRQQLQYTLLYTDNSNLQAGIYDLTLGSSSKRIGLNWNRQESNTTITDINSLGIDNIKIYEQNAIFQIPTGSHASNFPLWKAGIIIAILAVILETFLLRK